ncbi:elongation factor P ['Opuntia sp.' phytoplasma]|uniref:Elongation factor P n=1 Tax=Candidatus Phytoplasma asiaticum TaxID=2763338 RepID=A0AAX3B9E4_9MOLU|nr:MULTISPECIES: elongation factor P [Phytoplasma]MDO8054043.1 elongation factor P ['Opuntia sp.' phytoplasma]MDO8057899.1 elongation factor P ['Opuntia sp.' phytoplasma]UQV27264.1 elongation factor P ['Parthenium hysterophorus' phyllody phytoplasma]
MINTNDFKTGMTIKLKNNIYQIIDFLHVKPGKGSAFVRSKLKNLKTGSIIEYTFNSGIKIETALVNKVKLKFSYIQNGIYVFVNENTYEQIEIAELDIISIKKYLAEDVVVEFLFCDQNNILGTILPDKIVLKVYQTDPIISGENNRKSNTAYKDAILETGLVIKVPVFIGIGEKIIINTSNDCYVSRYNEK